MALLLSLLNTKACKEEVTGRLHCARRNTSDELMKIGIAYKTAGMQQLGIREEVKSS